MLHDGVNKMDAAGAKAEAGISYSCYFNTPFVALYDLRRLVVFSIY